MPTQLIEGRDGRHVVGLGDLFSSEEGKQPSPGESRRGASRAVQATCRYLPGRRTRM
jgi:hypothetical protein